MLGLSSKSPEAAPAYEELDTIREPSNSNGVCDAPYIFTLTKQNKKKERKGKGDTEVLTTRIQYFAVPKDDTERAQGPADEEQPHDHTHKLSLSKFSCGDCSLPPPRTFQPHVHCDVCDAFLTRHQRVRNERFYCGMVAATVMFALLCGLMLAVVVSCTKRR
ncbi:hypothetical protein BDV11DRAFT_199478 [Aspergillus similis]